MTFFTPPQLAKKVVSLLKKRGQQIAVAESCTGGLLASCLTSVSGASQVFRLGIVAYGGQSKQKWVGISKKMIRQRGLISKEVASSLAQGIKKRAKSFLGVGITGVAGPTGGTRQIPVGVVYIAVASPHVWVEKFYFRGGRNKVRERATKAALKMIYQTLTKGSKTH